MSVNAGMRNVPDTPSNRQCNAVESALALCLHTIKICSNRNIFTVEYIDIVSMAVNVSMENIFKFQYCKQYSCNG